MGKNLLKGRPTKSTDLPRAKHTVDRLDPQPPDFATLDQQDSQALSRRSFVEGGLLAVGPVIHRSIR